MMRIFKIIRRKTPVENKTREYLKYAILEVILVMAGILLALQINNWNEERKDKIKEKSLLDDLIENLEINIHLLFEGLEIDKKAIQSSEIILDIIRNNKQYSDSLDVHFQNSRIVKHPYLSNSAFEAIENEGFYIIRSKELRKEIINLFDNTYPSMTREISLIDETVIKPTMQMFMIDNFEQINNRSVPNDFNRLLDNQQYINILTINMSLQTWFKNQRNHSLNETERLLQHIKNELN